jgi:zinc D-Ala-D-Ala dipeptidase
MMKKVRPVRRHVLVGLSLLPLVGCESEQRPTAKPKRTAEPAPVAMSGLVELTKLDPTIKLDIRYATPDNFTGRVLYSQARAFLMAEPAAALVRASAHARAEGYGLTIFDAYRPWRVTKALWDATPRSQRGFVANPKDGSKHNRGSAVDLSLYNLRTGALVEMPTPYDDFSRRAYRDFEPVSVVARSNRVRLEQWMEAEGFKGIHNEWWHFDWKNWRDYPILDLPFEDL